MNFTIGLDVDGVVADFVGGAMGVINASCADKRRAEDVVGDDVMACFSFTDYERFLILRRLRAPGFARSLKPLHGAVHAVQRLRSMHGVDVVFVTSPLRGSATWQTDREDWLATRFPGINVMFMHHKEYADVDLLIDDTPANVKSTLARHGPGSALLWVTPYNRHGGKLPSIASWGALIAHVKSRLPQPLDFSALRRANVARMPQFKNALGEPVHHASNGSDWSDAEWLQAVVGELGEYANLRKKVQRGDLTPEKAKPLLADELADTTIYLDILAYRLGIDLGQAVVAKFDRVSRRVGATVFLGESE